MPKQARKIPNPRRAKAKKAKAASAPQTKLDQIAHALRSRGGATIPDLMELTGWQSHSVRGALAGALKKRGLEIQSDRVSGERRYRIASGA